MTIISNTLQVQIDEESLELISPLRAPGLNNIEGNIYNQTECSICMEEYHNKQLIRILPCNHVFHAHCIDPWSNL